MDKLFLSYVEYYEIRDMANLRKEKLKSIFISKGILQMRSVSSFSEDACCLFAHPNIFISYLCGAPNPQCVAAGSTRFINRLKKIIFLLCLKSHILSLHLIRKNCKRLALHFARS